MIPYKSTMTYICGRTKDGGWRCLEKQSMRKSEIQQNALEGKDK